MDCRQKYHSLTCQYKVGFAPEDHTTAKTLGCGNFADIPRFHLSLEFSRGKRFHMPGIVSSLIGGLPTFEGRCAIQIALPWAFLQAFPSFLLYGVFLSTHCEAADFIVVLDFLVGSALQTGRLDGLSRLLDLTIRFKWAIVSDMATVYVGVAVTKRASKLFGENALSAVFQ